MKKILSKKILTSFFKSYFAAEFAVGIILIFATVIAILFSNSSNSSLYFDFFNQNFDLKISFLAIEKKLTLRDWINDALMAIFFFLVGLELKSEVIKGELSSKKKLALPLICAVGGVLLPMLLFLLFNLKHPENLRGLAIACATDIAFAYGFIALFGKIFSNSVKIFLVALAVIDDLIAILIIAFFYTDNLQMNYLGYALIICLGLYFLNFKKSTNWFFYLLLGILLWLMILKSGVHATIAGVLCALFIPFKVNKINFLEIIAHKISPVVNFFILPVFAFGNSGVDLSNFSFSRLSSQLIISIVIALFFGKQIGVMLFAFVSNKFFAIKLPRGTNWLEFYGVSLFTGIGFTMSLFIASLAFNQDLARFDEAKIGVIIGSLLSVISGAIIAIILSKMPRK